jgi:hypothetical protein
MLRRGLIVRAIYATCLAGATLNHVRAIAAHGLLPDFLPWGSAVYWSSLTLLDPLAALLLFLRPRLGIVLTAAIIVTDVAHNLWFVAHFASAQSLGAAIRGNPFLLSQIAFLLLVAATARIAWREAAAVRADPRAPEPFGK